MVLGKIDECGSEQISESFVRLVGRAHRLEGLRCTFLFRRRSGQSHPFLGPPCGSGAPLVLLQDGDALGGKFG
jgi:hypothetical protein